MSAARADRLERLRRLQKRRREIEEWRLAALERKAADLAAEAREILESLGDLSPLNGLFLEAKAVRLRRKEAERQAVLAEAAEARARLAEAGTVEKRIERMADEAAATRRRAEEARELSDIVEIHLGRSASLE